jgi:hypothetical protein
VNLKQSQTNESLEELEKSLQPPFKITMINLSEGENQSQLMTSSWATGNYDEVCNRVENTYLAPLSKEGFKVTRIKIESNAGNQGVPEQLQSERSTPIPTILSFTGKWKQIWR